MDKLMDNATGATGGEGTAVPFDQQFCENCRCWIEYDGKVSTIERDRTGHDQMVKVEAGECRALPPTVNRKAVGIDAVWPTTLPNHWCAAWRNGGGR